MFWWSREPETWRAQREIKFVKKDLQSINQSIILFSDKSRLQKCSHDADVDLQLTSKM